MTKLETYRRYYQLIAEHPGLTLAEYAKMVPTIGYTHLKHILANMEYYGFLLYEGPSGDLHPFDIVRRLPGDLREIPPIGRDCRWRRTGSTLPRYEPRRGKSPTWMPR